MNKVVLLLLLVPWLALSQSSYDQGKRLYDQEKYLQAKPYFESHLKQHPKDKNTIESLGDIAGFQKDWDTAIEHYKNLLDLEQDNANYHFKYGGALGMKALEISRIRALSYVGDIKKHFLKAARLDPKHIEVRWALVEFYIQLPGIIGGSERKAIRYANELASLSPVDGYLANGYIAEYSKRPDDAERYYKKAVEVGGSVHTYEKLSGLYESTNQPVKAIQTVNNCLKLHDRNQLRYQIGKISAQYNLDHELGISCLEAYIQKHSAKDGVPKDWAYYRLAQIYKNLGEKQTALQYIQRALEDRPDFEEALKEKKLIESL